jgi:protease-4
MKKHYMFLIVLLALSVNICSQDFNLFNPSNELYLFSAYDEGSNAFRYNPAVLGLGHRLSFSLNAFMKNKGEVNLSDLDILVSSGALGLAFRKYSDDIALVKKQVITPDSTYYITGYDHLDDYSISTFSLGFGAGSKQFSAGLLFELLSHQKFQSPAEAYSDHPSFRMGLGLLFRPLPYTSFSFVYKNDESLTITKTTTDKFTFGAAIRPLKDDRITVMADFSAFRYGNNFFDCNQVKAGFDFRLTKGLYLNFNYTRNKTDFKNEYLAAGIRFDLPNGSIRYNHIMNNSRAENPGKPLYYGSSIYQDAAGIKYKFIGSSISLSYNLERRKSLIPEKKKIIEITLSGSLQDYNTEDVFFGLLGKGKKSIHEVIADIDYASADESVKGMLLKIYPISSGRFEVNGSIEELTNSMKRFRTSGKNITVYFPQDAGPGEYYIATFANDIVLPPEAVFFYGLSINVMNYNQFLAKYGIDLQTFHAGRYKLTFQGLLDSTSEEGKEVINRVLDIVYEKMLTRIVSGRNLTIDDYLKDKLSQPLTGTEAMRLGLVDKLGWYEDAKEIASRSGRTENIVKSFNRSEWDNSWGEPSQIAIIGVYASITTGESEPPPPISLPIPFIGGGRSTGSETVVRQLEDAFANPMIKAIVLRVDSGGGSALGSAEINSAIIRLRKKYKKPLIVSMGGAAASGGYYVSTSADRIFSDELTVTGSIGVFTARPNLDSLMKQQKIKVENFKRGENSDIGSFYKELDEKEIEIIQGIIDYYYDRFITAVAEGRNMSKEEADQVAQGRVWLGTDAFNKKLVDEIGGLYEAIKYAKKLTSISGRYKLVYYAVPGGNKINEIVTGSVVSYFQQNLIDLLGLEENSDGLEIKY